MIKAWVARNVSSVVTATSVALIALLVAIVAFVSQGYTAQRLDLGDGSVWVPNGQAQVIGRANTEILLLNTVVESTSSEIDVVQDGSTVLLVDRANTRLDIVDPANSEVVDSVVLPSEGPRVHVSGEVAVIHSEGTGEVWILAEGELGAFDAASEPALSLGPNAAVTVTPDGILHAFSSDTGQLYRAELARGAAALATGAESRVIDFAGDSEDVDISAVGERVVVFEHSSRNLWVDGDVVDLSGYMDEGEPPVLQRAGTDAGAVLLAWSGGLLEVDFDGVVDVLVEGRSAVPAAPIVTGNCAFAAWADGLAWRDCEGPPVELELAAADAGAVRLEFAVNGDRVVLNDPASGLTWAVQSGGELIDNWDELITVEENQEQFEQGDTDTPPEFEKVQVAPVAVDDEFGARPDRATVLPVLLNDYDANGDVLVVSEVETIDESVGRIDLVRDRQQIQLTLAPTALGPVTFGYTITDGRGGSASATVTVAVRSADENSAPVQVRQSRTSLAQGGRVTANVLGDWVDPDGDAFYLVGASTTSPDTVSYKPEGAVVFQEGGASGSLRTVALAVTDGMARGAGSLSVTVSPPGEVPIIADPFAVTSYAGGEVRVAPLEHVRGGTGSVRLSAVPSRAGATITVNLDNGTFRFTSDQVRTFYVEYVVTDGSQTVTGQVRIDVEAPPDANSTPITIPKTVFIKTLTEETIDVASLDTDPAGGVLMVTSVSTERAPGVLAEILEQRSVRLTLIAPLENGPVSVTYRITNGLAEAEGTITVIEIPVPDQLQAPVASDDSVTVRVGDTIDIAVLANDLHPDGEPLTLNPELVERGVGSGLLFASGDRLRYLAPQQTGDFTAVYEIAGPDGQTSQAQVRIAVREIVEATNNPPTPATVTARVIAGGTVAIRIPLTGIDPDGDSVQLLGQESAPEKGAVTNVGTDFIEYEAGGYSAGTDRFTYTVMDSLGARAIGTVRIGISPPLQEARNPVATADHVTTKPGGSISVQVLANDIDPDGGVLTVTSVEPQTTDVTAEIIGDVVVVTPSAETGQYGLVYTIENEFGGTSSNFITVTVDPDAPYAYPLAADTVLTLSDILDRETVTVQVLNNVFFADGPVDTLTVELLDGFRENAEVADDGAVTVTIAERAQIIPFSVIHPDDPEVVSYAFIRVPGFDDALPQLDRRAKPLSVVSESRLVIDLNDYVIAVGGNPVRLTDRTTVTASNANGDSLVVDDDTLAFTSADTYFGPASISFEVTDGASAGEAGARTATLVLPIRVTPRENQAPVFTGGSIEFEPAEEKVLDLLKLTNYPHPDDIDELTYRVLEPLPRDFSYTLTGSTLTVRADPAAARGSKTAITIGVRDDLSDGQAGTISLNVVSSTRPLARPAPDTAVTPRGKTTVIDVLANDAAANPFPGQPLTVVAIRGIEGGSLPEGVSVVPSADRSRLTVTVAAGAQPRDTQLQYQVADATGDPSRYVWGTVTISVQDVPDAPIAPSRAGGHTNGSVTLRITPPAFNNSAITSFEVVTDGGYRRDCGLEQMCTLDDLAVGESYEFRVIATNALGPSAASPRSVPLRADYLPAAPTGLTATASRGAEGELAIDWAAVPNPSPGTPVTGYTVRISGPGVGQTDIATTATSLTTTAGGLVQPGQTYQIVVFARNAAQATSEEWNRTAPTSVTAVGRPLPLAVTASFISTNSSISVAWAGGGWNGATNGTYHVARYRGEAPPTTCTSGVYPNRIAGPTSSGWSDTSAEDGVAYVYAVYSDNGLFCSVSVSSPVENKRPPGQATAQLDVTHQSGGNHDLRVRRLAASGIPVRYEVMLNGSGEWRPVVNDQFVTPTASGSVYGQVVTVQVRACRDAGQELCGAPSVPMQATPVETRASVLSCTAGEPFTPIAPANNGATFGLSYLVSYEILPGAWSRFATWNEGDSVPLTASALRIRASVDTGTKTYEDPEYGETQCG